MSHRTLHRLGDLQLKIMKILWDRTEATVADVHQALAETSDLAYTTVATMLRKMETRGLVEHRAEERAFVYRARMSSNEVSQSLVGNLLDRMFEGSLANMVNHLLTTREVSREELARLEKLIADRKRKP